MTATRSPSVIASTWSWVTYTDVVGTSWWIFLSSARSWVAQLGVEVGQRLVQQEHLGVAGQCPAHRNPLALTAR